MGVKTKYIEWIAQNVTTYNDLNICHTVNDNSIILLLAITTIQIRQTVYCVHYLSRETDLQTIFPDNMLPSWN